MSLRKNQRVTVSAKPLDAAGEPTSIQPGTAVWKSSDDSIVTVTPNPDNELEAEVVSNTKLGAAFVTLEADGDPSGETVQIFGSGDASVLGENAVGFDLSFGDVSTA